MVHSHAVGDFLYIFKIGFPKIAVVIGDDQDIKSHVHQVVEGICRTPPPVVNHQAVIFSLFLPAGLPELLLEVLQGTCGASLAGLNGARVTDQAVAQAFCRGSTGEFGYGMTLEASESDAAGATLAKYKRTRALTSKNGKPSVSSTATSPCL